MLEKFSADEVGVPGGGGEYEVQEGFGWTNGVTLDLLARYPDLSSGAGSSRAGGLVVNLLVVIKIVMNYIV